MRWAGISPERWRSRVPVSARLTFALLSVSGSIGLLLLTHYMEQRRSKWSRLFDAPARPHPARCKDRVRCGVTSNRHAIAVELVVLVVATLPRAQVREAFDELDGLNPLHLLEAQLELVA